MTALAAFPPAFAGEVVLPDDPGYEEARRIWNAMFDRRPALVVRPTTPGDVATAIRYAREHDLLVAVRGGGHSIPGLSSVDDGVVSDLSLMRGVEVDAERRWARVAAGCLLGELDDAAQRHSLACPVGTVSHTGVAGLTLGGGLGRLQRTFGLTIDALLAVDLVTADGREVRASEDENPELFWGLRGAGANFGVATSFEFRLHPLDPVITYGSVIHPIARAVELGELVEELFASTSRDLWLSFDMGPGLGADTFRPPDTGLGAVARVTAHHVGTEAEAERELAPLRRFNEPLADSIKRRPYLEAQRMNDVPSAWGQRFYMKSAFLSSLPRSMVDASVDHVAQIEDGIDGVVSIWTCGGAISDTSEEATAFTGREGAFWASAEVLWQDAALDEESRAWGRRFVADVAGVAVTGRYVNDVSEAAEDPRAIYGDAKQERLVALKREWDPDNVFRLNQNIRP
ncbi:MAG: FAD-binding oxidoreductase [Gaiellaceae bacterium]